MRRRLSPTLDVAFAVVGIVLSGILIYSLRAHEHQVVKVPVCEISGEGGSPAPLPPQAMGDRR